MGMNVRELIDFLTEQPSDAEVELAIIAPVSAETDDITVDRYAVDGALPWTDESDDGEELVIWLIGGEEPDVDQFLDAIEEPEADTDAG
jgi:hypothetical protein